MLTIEEKNKRKAATKKAWYERDKKARYLKNLEWRANNRERWLELKRRYHKTSSARRVNDTPEQKEVRRKRLYENERRSYEKGPFRHLLVVAKKRAKLQGRAFDLTLEWGRARWTGKCEITGATFILERGRANSFAPSVDRIDSAKGYTQDNCRFVLLAVNRLKGDESDEVMRQIARLVVGH